MDDLKIHSVVTKMIFLWKFSSILSGGVEIFLYIYQSYVYLLIVVSFYLKVFYQDDVSVVSLIMVDSLVVSSLIHAQYLDGIYLIVVHDLLVAEFVVLDW